MARKSRAAPVIEGGETPLVELPGVGPQGASKLAACGLVRVRDLWFWLPRSYEDRTRLTPVAALQAGVPAQVEGTILAVERAFRFRPMLKVALADDSRGTLVLRFFHFRSQQANALRAGARLRAYGTPRPGQLGLEMVHPSYQLPADPGQALETALAPVYPAVEGIGPQTLRRLVERALAVLPDAEALELLPHA